MYCANRRIHSRIRGVMGITRKFGGPDSMIIWTYDPNLISVFHWALFLTPLFVLGVEVSCMVAAHYRFKLHYSAGRSAKSFAFILSTMEMYVTGSGHMGRPTQDTTTIPVASGTCIVGASGVHAQPTFSLRLTRSMHE